MGFLAFCGLLYVIVMIIWSAWKSKEDRAKLVKEFKEKPIPFIFLVLWIGSIFMFVIGIFAPIFGEAEFLDTGWQVWQVGGLAALFGFIITEIFPNFISDD